LAAVSAHSLACVVFEREGKAERETGKALLLMQKRVKKAEAEAG